MSDGHAFQWSPGGLIPMATVTLTGFTHEWSPTEEELAYGKRLAAERDANDAKIKTGV